jgi:hypothetical protein
MSTLPPITVRPVSPARQDFLRRWFALWQTEQHMLAADAPAPPEQATAPATRPVIIHPFHDAPLQLGEIRLLAPELTPEADEPVYIAVISEWKPVGFLVAPFSRFPVPALPGELRTSRTEPRLRTLAVWNGHTLEPHALKQSWLVGHLTPEDTRAARAVFRHVMFGHALDATLLERTGAPLAHPEDPRLTYERAELLRVTGLGRLQHHLDRPVTRGELIDLIAEAERIANTRTDAPRPEEDLALAAASNFSNPAIVVVKGDAPRPVCLRFLADADGEFILEPHQTLVPDTLWTLRGITPEDAAKLADANVLLIDKRNKVVVAEGQMDPSGTIVSAHTIKPEALGGQPFHAGDLMLLIMLE